MRRTRGRLIGGLIAFVVFLAAAVALLIWRQVYVEKLNRKLIAAIKANDTKQVTALLNGGADANAHDIPPRKLSPGEILLEVLHHRTDSPHAPSRCNSPWTGDRIPPLPSSRQYRIRR